MLLSRHKTICILLPFIVSALAQEETEEESSLPEDLQNAVPACAQSCLRGSLIDQFPTSCTADPIDVGCLCSNYSNRGETLGEAALACIYASCENDDQAAPAYNICLGKEGAVVPTQTALTVQPSPTEASPQQTDSEATPTTTPSPEQTPDNASAGVAGIASPTSSRATASATARAASAPGPAPKMTTAQIAGLSVAVVASFVLAIGLMVMSISLRKKREQQQEQADAEKFKSFQGDMSPHSPFQLTALSTQPAPTEYPVYPQRQKTVRHADSTVMFSGPYNSNASESSLPTRANVGKNLPQIPQPQASKSAVSLDKIGLALSPDRPESASSRVTAFPGASPRFDARQPRPTSLLMANGQRPDSVMTQDTVFEEDNGFGRRRSSTLLPTPPITVPPMRPLHPARSPSLLNPSALPPRANRPPGAQQPGLSLNIPVLHSRSLAESAAFKPIPPIPPLASPIRMSTVPVQMPGAPIPMSAGAVSMHADPIQMPPMPTDPGADNDIPDYYFASERSSPERGVSSYYGGPPERVPNAFLPLKGKNSASTVSMTASGASTNVRDSMASQTSFESVDSYDPTPEDEDLDKQLAGGGGLSPVAESPISMLRYPKIPRASNQLVPRSPQSPRSSHTYDSPRRSPAPSALLVKRRGETEALKLEDRLKMDSPRRTEIRDHIKNYTQLVRSISTTRDSALVRSRASHAAQYDVPAVPPLNIRSSQQPPPPPPKPQSQRPVPGYEALKSPGWVPNLTPKRHGEDLFLDVSYTKPVV